LDRERQEHENEKNKLTEEVAQLQSKLSDERATHTKASAAASQATSKQRDDHQQAIKHAGHEERAKYMKQTAALRKEMEDEVLSDPFTQMQPRYNTTAAATAAAAVVIQCFSCV
jgi:Skp family chaperone for outer membrane proteins